METEVVPYHFIRSKILRNALENEDPDLALLPEHEIIANATPTSTLWELRARLWILLDKRNEEVRKYGTCDALGVNEIREGICSLAQFNRFLKNHFQAAFLCRPLASPESRQEVMVRAANARIAEVLAMPIKDKHGVPDKAIMKMVLDTAKMVMDRKYGTAIQRSETLARIQTQQSIAPKPSVQVIEQDIEALNARTAHAADIIVEAEETGGT